MSDKAASVPKGHPEASFRYKKFPRKVAGKAASVHKGHHEASFRYKKLPRMVAGKGKTVPKGHPEASFRYKNVRIRLYGVMLFYNQLNLFYIHM